MPAPTPSTTRMGASGTSQSGRRRVGAVTASLCSTAAGGTAGIRVSTSATTIPTAARYSTAVPPSASAPPSAAATASSDSTICALPSATATATAVRSRCRARWVR